MHSDPKHELLLRTVGAEPGSASEHSLYRKKEFDSLASAGYKRYTMVQPAFVVVDKTGNVSQAWSWMTADQGCNSIALLKSPQQTVQQTFQQSFQYYRVSHTTIKTLLKSLLRFQQSY